MVTTGPAVWREVKDRGTQRELSDTYTVKEFTTDVEDITNVVKELDQLSITPSGVEKRIRLAGWATFTEQAAAAEIVTMTIRLTNTSGAVQGACTAIGNVAASESITLICKGIASPSSASATIYMLCAVLSSTGNVDAIQGGIEAWELT